MPHKFTYLPSLAGCLDAPRLGSDAEGYFPPSKNEYQDYRNTLDFVFLVRPLQVFPLLVLICFVFFTCLLILFGYKQTWVSPCVMPDFADGLIVNFSVICVLLPFSSFCSFCRTHFCCIYIYKQRDKSCVAFWGDPSGSYTAIGSFWILDTGCFGKSIRW